MADVVIPVLLSLFLGPGIGQLYNKEYRKGAYLIGLSLLILLAAGWWFRKVALLYLPTDFTAIDPTALQPIMQDVVRRIVGGHAKVLYTYEGLLIALWLYSAADAYYGGVRRRQQRAQLK